MNPKLNGRPMTKVKGPELTLSATRVCVRDGWEVHNMHPDQGRKV